MHGEGKFLGQADHDAAPGRAVELGHHQPGYVDHVLEGFDLTVRVLADGTVHDQKGGVRCRFVDLLDDANDLFKLRHQILAVLQPPCRIDQNDLDIVRLGLFQCAIGKAGGIGAVIAGNDGAAGTFAPYLELLDGGGAEGITGDQHHRLAIGLEAVGELADGRGLARAVDAADQYDVRPVLGIYFKRLGDGIQDCRHFLGQRFADFFVGDVLVEFRFCQGIDQLGRCGDADIGGDQGFLEFIKRGLIQLAGTEDRCD